MAYRRLFFIVLFIAFLWLRRWCSARRHLFLANSVARRLRILSFTIRQHEERAILLQHLTHRISASSLTRRTIWRKLRNHSFLTDATSYWSNIEWKQNFRVSRATFHFLCVKLQPYLERHHVLREPLSVEQRVAIALWRLGTNIEYRTISHLFGVGLSTACVPVHDVCNAIVEHLAAQYISIPTGQGLQRIVNGFSTKWGFPQCIGAIDGSHIPIIAPKENPLDYYNRKGYHSVVLQALVDHEYKFMDVYVGWPGSVYDARVLANSRLYQKCESGTFLPAWQQTLCGTNIPLLILGDPAYPLKVWLMKPFSDIGLTRAQKKFNYQLSRSRAVS